MNSPASNPIEVISSFVAKRGKNYGVEHLLAPRSGPLSDILKETLQLNPTRTEFLLNFGAIYLNESRLNPDSPEVAVDIEKGTYLRVHQNPRRFPVEVFNAQEIIVTENEDLIVVNKPSGLPVHPTVDNTQENLASLLEAQLAKKLYVTHRLDVGTSGLLVLAKSKQAQSEFNTMLMQGEIQKIYRARTEGQGRLNGKVPGDFQPELVHYMEPSPRAPKVVSLQAKPGWAQCRLKILDQNYLPNNTSEFVIELITGRTHQIRAQLSASGFPILGDVAYGAKTALADYEKIALQAFYLNFNWKNQDIRLSLKSPWS